MVHDKLMNIGSELVLKTVQAIELNTVVSKSQILHHTSQIQLKHASKIFKETCLIDWTKPALEVHNLIRGLSPYPAAFTYLDGKVLKIFASKINQPNNSLNTEHQLSTTDYKTDNKTYLSFKCADKYLDILELQLEGKKRMKIDEFLRGYKFQN